MGADARGALVKLLIAAAVTWHLLVTLAPAWVTVSTKPSLGRDFASYYYAVQVAADGKDPYAKGNLSKAARESGKKRGVHPFLYPPPFLLVMVWALPLDLMTAYKTWFWLDEIWLAAAMFALWAWWKPMGRGVGVLLAISVAAFTAVSGNHIMGQANFVGLAFAVAGLWQADRGRWLVGGALMGAACMVKMSPALFVAWWLMRGKWREALAACMSALLLSVAALPLIGFEHQLAFYTRVLPLFGSGDYNGLTIPIDMFGNHSMPNLWHQLRWIPGPRLSTTAQTLSSMTAISLVLGLGWRFRYEDADLLARANQVGAIGIAMLLVPVYTYEHHCIWALPAIVASVLALTQGRLGWGWAPVLSLAFCFWAVEISDMKRMHLSVKSSLPALGWLIQEAKFMALLVFGAASALAGARTGPIYNAVPGEREHVPAQ